MAAHASVAAAACANPVACENALAGDSPSDWEVNGAGDTTIQGYATQMSVNVGGTEQFKIKTPSTKYHIDILRLGYYGGNGARLIAGNLTPANPATQPACLTFQSTGLVDCGNWSVSLSWTVPSSAVSGVYLADLKRNDTGGESQVILVVRDSSSHWRSRARPPRRRRRCRSHPRACRSPPRRAAPARPPRRSPWPTPAAAR